LHQTRALNEKKETQPMRDNTALVTKLAIVLSTTHSSIHPQLQTNQSHMQPCNMSCQTSAHIMLSPCTHCHVPQSRSALTADMQLPQNKHNVTFYEPKSPPPPTPTLSCCTQVRAAYLKHAFNDRGDSRWQMAVLGYRTRDPRAPLHQPLMTICDI
jgi:hypothetical protein